MMVIELRAGFCCGRLLRELRSLRRGSECRGLGGGLHRSFICWGGFGGKGAKGDGDGIWLQTKGGSAQAVDADANETDDEGVAGQGDAAAGGKLRADRDFFGVVAGFGDLDDDALFCAAA